MFGSSSVFRGLAGVAVALALSACATTPAPLIAQEATSMRTAIASVRDQSRTAFDSANSLARDQAIEFQVLAAKPLREDAFTIPVTPADAQAWANDLDVLDAYASALQDLTAPDRAEKTGAALEALGNQLSTGKTQLKINPSLQGLGVALGQALVEAKSASAATEAMRKADPAVQKIVTAMAEAIGDRPQPGNLQQNVWANWLGGQLSQITVAYQPLTTPAAAGQSDARRTLIKRYIGALDARDAQLHELSMLHDALLALGQVHAAAAGGKPGGAAYWVARLDGWTKDIKAHAEAAKKAQDEARKQ